MFQPVEKITIDIDPNEVRRTVRRHMIRTWRKIVGIEFFIYCTTRVISKSNTFTTTVRSGGLASLDWNREHKFLDSIYPIRILTRDTVEDINEEIEGKYSDISLPKIPYVISMIEEMARENYDLFKDTHERGVEIDLNELRDDEIGYVDYKNCRYVYIKDMSIKRAVSFLKKIK